MEYEELLPVYDINRIEEFSLAKPYAESTESLGHRCQSLYFESVLPGHGISLIIVALQYFLTFPVEPQHSMRGSSNPRDTIRQLRA